MKKIAFLLFACWITTAQAQTKLSADEMSALVEESLQFSARQYKHMMRSVPDSLLPRSTNTDGSLMTAKFNWWTGGFYPGSCWYLYEYSKDPVFRQEAVKRMTLLLPNQYRTNTHDLGFLMYCSFGNGLRLEGTEAYKDILMTSSRSLSTRFKPTIGAIRSWDHRQWKCPVIIDNMMNLEMLFWASKHSGDPAFRDIAVAHANTTMKNHFRPDYSSYHVVDYDSISGQVIARKTHQGHADESAWSRGQAWGLYGYTLMYRETKDKKYLTQARRIADYMLNHPRMPEDLVPYYDYDAPEIPNAIRDASAAAVMSSALLELSRYTKKRDSKRYWNAGADALASLAGPAYRAKEGENNHFILMHSTGSKPGNSELDVPLTYADYYFLEALLRYRQWK
ncbi:glycoside hydrolase family 88 protein [Chitinophaga sp. XS-30]|uniref:glycoside hydrolase family 88 protein n=1 Tax=Chitinophaga sp. XS-30 TaxID=2604421 RepID=UPI0011DC849C|nr:glycoside hydrolase family 88 protein [Chitinophaga sp. XS-30]QEH40884.1 glucuronyl hydrolase [Chitinophaga sp. XS-30]